MREDVKLIVRLSDRVLHYTGMGTLVNETRGERVERIHSYPDRWVLKAPKVTIDAPAAIVQERIDKEWLATDVCYCERNAKLDSMGTAETHIALLNDLAREPKPEPTTIASEAHALVTGPKAEAYGTWESNMTRAADILHTVYGIELAPTEIIKVMLAVKLSRDFHKPQRDNPVDIAGYYSGLAELESRYKK